MRPSGDRARETVFNWLAPHIDGARCLDLFAGSGALGFEAVSRGADTAVLIEQDPVAGAALEALRTRLGADPSMIEIIRRDAIEWLGSTPRDFDLVFVDPPFDTTLGTEALELLEQGRLADHGLVYLEQALEAPPPGAAWDVWRSGRTRHTRYNLLRRAR